MKTVDFPERNVEIAKNQPQFNTLPAFANKDDASFTYCFELDPVDFEKLKSNGGKIYFKQIVGLDEIGDFNPFQPIRASVNKDYLIPK